METGYVNPIRPMAIPFTQAERIPTDMQKKGVIHSSNSSWASLVFVKKKDESISAEITA